MTWLGISIALSLVLTIVLNVWLRLFPDVGRRVASHFDDVGGSNHRVRLWTPWRAMILGSVILTIVVNLVIWIAGH